MGQTGRLDGPDFKEWKKGRGGRPISSNCLHDGTFGKRRIALEEGDKKGSNRAVSTLHRPIFQTWGQGEEKREEISCREVV